MRLATVTITGADDAVDPTELVRLQERFPWVEWGVLISRTRAGEPRYPTWDWLAGLADRGLNLSAHLCGGEARAVLEGQTTVALERATVLARRIQLNGWEPGLRHPTGERSAPTFAKRVCDYPSVEFILQARTEEDLQAAAREAAAAVLRFRGGKASALYDPSGGRGLETFKWPTAPLGLSVGFAGGIREDNLVETLRGIHAANETRAEDYWIDLESGVRDEQDRFDLGKVESFLSTTSPFVGDVLDDEDGLAGDRA